MPTTYAHDLYGKRVYREMPPEMKRIVRKNEELFRIGLHGPDILLYDITSRKVYKLGSWMHRKIASPFFCHCMKMAREEKNEPLLAYLLGFGLHYLLDSDCHPYVREMDRQGKISHTLLEKELDRALMVRDGKDPHHFYPSECIVPRVSYGYLIHRVIPWVSAGEIYHCLKMMKFLTNSMVYDNRGKRRSLIWILTLFLNKKYSVLLMDHYMTGEAPKGSEPYVEEAVGIYEKSLEEAPDYINELFALYYRPGKLSERWHRTYNG